MKEGSPDPASEDLDILSDELSLCTVPGGARVAGEHLDGVLVELRGLCEMQRQIVLDEAAQGFDCHVEAQELNRIMALEEDVTKELLALRGEPWPEPKAGEGEPPSEGKLRLCSLQSDVGGGCEAQVEGQTGPPLQTKIISIEEVLKDIEEWWNPMLAEYQALVQDKQVVVPVTAKELARREAAGEAFQVIPAKLIFTLKAFTARRKVRCVGCGNYLGEGMYSASQLYAGGLDVVSLRCCLVLMASKMWSAGVVDIKTAFLNAELEKEDLGTKRVVIRTPTLWRRLGVCEETFWDVRRAMYGLQISPAAWSRCRDRKLPSLKLMTCVGLVRLLQFKSDPNIWAIVPAQLSEPVDPEKRVGLLLVYVDDMMVLSTPQIITDIIAELGKTWELSTPELLEDGNVHYPCPPGLLHPRAAFEVPRQGRCRGAGAATFGDNARYRAGPPNCEAGSAARWGTSLAQWSYSTRHPVWGRSDFQDDCCGCPRSCGHGRAGDQVPQTLSGERPLVRALGNVMGGGRGLVSAHGAPFAGGLQ